MNELTRLHPLPAMARRLRVPARWLRREAEAGRLPHLRAGAQFLFNAEAVENMLADRAALPRDSASEDRAGDSFREASNER